MNPKINVLGTEIQTCSKDPLTGWYRDGCCNTDSNDRGLHVVCCTVTDKFLEFAKSQGNDLITPAPQFNFPGLKHGDCWCVCASPKPFDAPVTKYTFSGAKQTPTLHTILKLLEE